MPLHWIILLKQEYHRKGRPFHLSYNKLNNLGGVQGVCPFAPGIIKTTPGGGRGGCSANCRINGRGDLFDDIIAFRGQFNGGASFWNDIITFVVCSMKGASFFRRRLFIWVSILFQVIKNYGAAVCTCWQPMYNSEEKNVKPKKI